MRKIYGNVYTSMMVRQASSTGQDLIPSWSLQRCEETRWVTLIVLFSINAGNWYWRGIFNARSPILTVCAPSALRLDVYCLYGLLHSRKPHTNSFRTEWTCTWCQWVNLLNWVKNISVSRFSWKIVMPQKNWIARWPRSPQTQSKIERETIRSLCTCAVNI